MSGSEAMTVFVIVFAGWILSVCCHEFGHAIVAYWGGDFTVREKGYLTFNPLRYTHPVLSLAMPLLFLMMGGIGLPGGAVYINDRLLRGRIWRSAVSLAGPAVSLLLAVLLAAPLWLGWLPSDAANPVSAAFAFLVLLQVSGILLNLLPVPPLDGFRVLAPWLPHAASQGLLRYSGGALLILFLAMWHIEPLNRAFWHAVLSVTDALGVARPLIRAGFAAFRFWEPA